MKRFLLPLALGALLMGALAASADDQNSPEERLRETLKSTLLQLRSVTEQRDDLQAQVTDLQSQTKDLQDKLDALTKQAAENQDSANKEIQVLKGQVSDQQDSIAALQQALEQWKASQQKAMTIATQTEDKRAKLAELAIQLQRVVDDQKVRNQEMYKLGMEILDRYEKFGLGEALTAKEPFVGITRTKFETLVQDYEDKLADQTITSEKTPDQKPKQQ